MQFKLQTDVDVLEKIGWELFVQKRFPNYALLWQKFVAPRTNRPKDIWAKANIIDEEINTEALL